MSITVDALSQGAQTSGATLTISHTVASGAVLYVFTIGQNAGAGTSPGIITSVTWNTTESLTAVGSEQVSTDSGFDINWWRIDNPTSGTHDIVITTSSILEASSGQGISLLGAKTSGSDGAIAGKHTDGSSVNTLSQALTTTAANSYILGGWGSNQNAQTTSVSGTNQTQQESTNVSNIRTSISTQTTTSIGSYTNTFTSTSSGLNCALSVIEVKVFVAVGPVNVKTYNGLAAASVKTVNGLAITSVKTFNGLG